MSYSKELKYFNVMTDDIFKFYYEHRQYLKSSLELYNIWVGRTIYPPIDDDMSKAAVEYFSVLKSTSLPLLDVLYRMD